MTVTNGPLARSNVAVDVARRHLLAGAGRAGQHHPAVGARHLVELALHLAEGALRADHHRPAAVAPLQRRVLAPEPRGLERPADHHHQLVDVERLLDEVVGALLDRGDGDLDVAVARDDHDRDRRIVALHPLQDVDAVEPAVLQPDVEDDEVGRRRGRSRRTPCRCPRPCGRRGPRRRGCRRSARGCRARRPPPGCRSSHALPQLFGYFALLGRRPMPRSGSACGSTMRAQAPAPALPSKTGRRHQLERAVVLLDDLLDDRQAEAGALRAMGDVGLEQPLRLVRQAGAVVLDVDDELARARRPASPGSRPAPIPAPAASRSSIASAAFFSRLVKAWLIIVAVEMRQHRRLGQARPRSGCPAARIPAAAPPR